MWNRNTVHNGKRFSLLLWPIIVVVLCAGYIAYSYTTNIMPDRLARTQFQETNCLVMSKRLNETGSLITRYRADFLVSYNVNRIQYSRWVAGNGLDESYFRNRSEQEALLNQYDVGSTYPCYYNPKNPQTSLLMQRHNWSSVYPLIVPLIIGLIALYYLVLNLIVISHRRH